VQTIKRYFEVVPKHVYNISNDRGFFHQHHVNYKQRQVCVSQDLRKRIRGVHEIRIFIFFEYPDLPNYSDLWI